MVCDTGLSPTFIVTALLLARQVPLLIFHCNTFAPALNPLTEVMAEVEFVNIALPLTTDHIPAPVEGVLAARVAVVVVMYWALPALDGVGGVSTVTVVPVDAVAHLDVLVTVRVYAPAVVAV